MKKIFLTLLLIAAGSAGATTVCQTHIPISPGSSFGETYEIKIENGVYLISHYGHSRNSYAAAYKRAKCLQTRAGGECQLTKVQDFSTWKDMPSELKIRSYVVDDRDDFSIGILDSKFITFSKQNECHNIPNQGN